MPAKLSCRVNGNEIVRTIDERLLLVEFVRDIVELKGTRVGCLTGDCGACTVNIGGDAIKSCMVLAMSAEGADITTIEGRDDIGHIQQAFVEENGFQCGFCTTGMVLTAAELLRDNPDPSEAEIRKAISGNLCRCTGYDAIVNSIKLAALKAREFQRDAGID
ncbi:(2Fe-2S)-binding protein [Rhizobium leguminosarum]|uniref:(2Fe-2S)-binding protein n=1 Tax=Rhizobium leguminosarum TaxID=384 RepID=UPI0013BC4644|nr:(2Fe-2S)-binding protein [Rhizobium leguminosarum]MCA2436739.1 (2Fe-2S)-binding protein [Rhizobium leguminosarum]NEH73449.1 4-hydroxybenzoyl-CoA reductase subunit gamma [Rhizobium leguminosarum]